MGAVVSAELPSCLIDNENGITGPLVDEMEKCGITLKLDDMIDISTMAHDSKKLSISNFPGLYAQPDRSNEKIQIMLSRHEVRKHQLQAIRSHMSELNDNKQHLISFRVVLLLDMWKVSKDVKVMCALFLLEKLDLSPKAAIPRLKRSPSFSEKLMTGRMINIPRTPSNISGRFDENKEKVKHTIGNAFSSMKSFVK